MSKFVILARSEIEAESLEQVALSDPEKDSIETILHVGVNYDLNCYRSIATKLESIAQSDRKSDLSTQITMLVDQVSMSHLRLLEINSWDSIIAMLIVSFPEFRWIFGVISDLSETGGEMVINPNNYNIDAMSNTYTDPIFDGYGLRQYIRKQLTEHQYTNRTTNYIPVRNKVAVVIEDEQCYSYFHSYIAYRFGFRTFAITTELELNQVLNNKSLRFNLSIEDLYLNFPDRTSDESLSNLDAREELFSVLQDTKLFRIFVTTGQQRNDGKGLDKIIQNRNSFLKMRNRGQIAKICYKPTGGIFGLWSESGLLQKLRGGGKHQTKGYAPGFIWPPEATWDDEHHGHSAPGRLLEISNRLRNRADKILKESTSIEDPIHAAVLATDALELLGGRTPTSSLEALSLKHKAEVTAECRFLGIQFDISVKPRLDELHKEVQRIGKWFNPSTKDHATKNTELCIITELAKIFRENARFDEEQLCLVRVRDLHRQLWFKSRPHFNYLIIPRVIQWYIDFLLRSLGHFVLAIGIWLLLLSVVFWWCDQGAWQHGPDYALTSFFFGGIPFSADGSMTLSHEGHFIIIMLSSVVGMLHFGVFINHLFSILNRR